MSFIVNKCHIFKWEQETENMSKICGVKHESEQSVKNVGVTIASSFIF